MRGLTQARKSSSFWRQVWMMLARIEWVFAPCGVRLPAESLRAITAGRKARSALPAAGRRVVGRLDGIVIEEGEEVVPMLVQALGKAGIVWVGEAA